MLKINLKNKKIILIYFQVKKHFKKQLPPQSQTLKEKKLKVHFMG
jgi:hypothetical protein